MQRVPAVYAALHLCCTSVDIPGAVGRRWKDSSYHAVIIVTSPIVTESSCWRRLLGIPTVDEQYARRPADTPLSCLAHKLTFPRLCNRDHRFSATDDPSFGFVSRATKCIHRKTAKDTPLTKKAIKRGRPLLREVGGVRFNDSKWKCNGVSSRKHGRTQQVPAKRFFEDTGRERERWPPDNKDTSKRLTRRVSPKPERRRVGNAGIRMCSVRHRLPPLPGHCSLFRVVR